MTLPTPGEIQVMEGRTLLHVETHADNPHGAGMPICSIPKSRAADADRIVLTWNSHDTLTSQNAKLREALELHKAWEALPTDRGGKNGTKGRAHTAFITARDAALASATAQGKDGHLK
jgi:hypothetical protein